MNTRPFGRLKSPVSEIGYGMWGLAGWKDTDDAEVQRALDLAVDSGITFYDTAFAYGDGRSEKILGALMKRRRGAPFFAASKIAPKNRTWPSRRGMPIDDVFPADYIRSSTEATLRNLGVQRIDLMQFHVWEDAWAKDLWWQRECEALKREGLVRAFGISVNRWEPWNVLETLKTGLIDSVQVVYNAFDQNPEDVLFPACRELGVAIIARVPFDEGSLTGEMTRSTRFPDGDFRGIYFTPETLAATMDRVDALRADLPAGLSLPEVALRFILSNPDVATVIPGMRRTSSVSRNIQAAGAGALDATLLALLRKHRWNRAPRPRAD
jgi:aryl-alcohol dehydrogenase-like predicted oxidoreductase